MRPGSPGGHFRSVVLVFSPSQQSVAEQLAFPDETIVVTNDGGTTASNMIAIDNLLAFLIIGGPGQEEASLYRTLLMVGCGPGARWRAG
jgi:L-lactate permease